MRDLDAGLDAVVSYLQGCLEGSGQPHEGLLPEVRTVLLDDQITTDAQQPAITVDWAAENMEATGLGATVQSRDEIEICLYLGSLPKGSRPRALARAIYNSEAGNKGLRRALLAFPPGSGFALTLLSARYLRRDERPEFRYTVGLLVRCAARQLGGR